MTERIASVNRNKFFGVLDKIIEDEFTNEYYKDFVKLVKEAYDFTHGEEEEE